MKSPRLVDTRNANSHTMSEHTQRTRLERSDSKPPVCVVTNRTSTADKHVVEGNRDVGFRMWSGTMYNRATWNCASQRKIFLRRVPTGNSGKDLYTYLFITPVLNQWFVYTLSEATRMNCVEIPFRILKIVHIFRCSQHTIERSGK